MNKYLHFFFLDSSQNRKCPKCLDMEAKLNKTVKEMEKETLRLQKKASQLKGTMSVGVKVYIGFHCFKNNYI